MVGFNMPNQTFPHSIFPRTQAKNTGVLIMFAVRRALSDPAELTATIRALPEKGQVDLSTYDPAAPLDFLIHPAGAQTIPEAAYRYYRYEPGVYVVPSGTGSVAHLEENIASILKPPLPGADVTRVNWLFAQVDSVSGN